MPTDMPPAQFNLQAQLPIIATAYAEGANQPYEAKRNILSTILNRAESGKSEFGAENGKVSEVLAKGYYSYRNQSPKFREAMSLKFPDDASKNAFNEYVKIYAGLLNGTVERSKAQFFFTPKEVDKIKRTKSMNMDALEKVGQPADHIFYSYKVKPPKMGGKVIKSLPKR